MVSTFTVPQATDLARHFLGREWRAAYANGECRLYNNQGLQAGASSWRLVFHAVGVSLPVRRRFASVGRRVMFGAQAVANCVSNSMASRVAGALNECDPDRRG